MRIVALLLLSSLALFGCPGGQRTEHAATEPVTAAQSGIATTTFKVKGMHCESCSQAIEGKLAGIDGVSTVSADWKAGRTIVQYDASKVTPREIIAAIDSLKFKATVSPSDP